MMRYSREIDAKPDKDAYVFPRQPYPCRCGTVIDLYIAKHPLEKQIEYNSKLLNQNLTPAITKDDIKNMSKEEMANLLMELIEK